MASRLLCNIWINSPQKKIIHPLSNEGIWFLTELMHYDLFQKMLGGNTMDSIIAPSQSGLVSSMLVLMHGRGCDYGPPSLPIECI